jgi:hypothetical protein
MGILPSNSNLGVEAEVASSTVERPVERGNLRQRQSETKGATEQWTGKVRISGTGW